MKKYFLYSFLLAIFIFSCNSQALAQRNPLNGQWLFKVQQGQAGESELPIPVTFKKKGLGTVSVPTGVLSMIYRESDTEFSSLTEYPMGLLTDGSDVTVLVRGTKDANTSVGTLTFIAEKPDPSNPLGILIVPFKYTASRQK
jgi:hypothetical protein